MHKWVISTESVGHEVFLCGGGRAEWGVTQTGHVGLTWSGQGAEILVEKKEAFHGEYLWCCLSISIGWKERMLKIIKWYNQFGKNLSLS